jgi:hypothetical protein
MDYVEFLIDEWRIPEQPRRLRACLRRVLTELVVEALLVLRREPKLQVMVCRDLSSEVDHVWAYFPMHPGLQTPKLRLPERGTVAELASAVRAANDDVYRRRLIAQQCKPKPTTRVLLVFSEPMIAKQPASDTEDQVRATSVTHFCSFAVRRHGTNAPIPSGNGRKIRVALRNGRK